MSKQIIELIEKGNEAFEGFKNNIIDRLDVLEAKGNRPGFGSSNLSGTQHEWKKAFDELKQKGFDGRLDISVKALTSDASFTLPGVLQPLSVTADSYSLFLADYIPQRIVSGPSVVINTIGSTASAGVQSSQGSAKQVITPDTASQTIALSTVADYTKVSVQALEDVPDLQNAVSGILHLAVKRKIDALLYATLCTTGNYTAFTSTSGKPAIDNITNALAKLANYGLQGTVFLNPADYATMVLTKASTAGTFLGLPDYEGISIKQASVVPTNKFLITTTDGLGAGLASMASAQIILGFENDDFTKNLRTLLVEQRIATYVTDSNRVIIGTLVAS